MNIRTRTAERLAAWARQRQGRDQLPLALRARRLYILPTRAGLACGALVLLMFVAGLNYGNNLALLLCFMLAGVALVVMYDTHRTLAGLVVSSVQALPAFAGSTGHIQLRLENPADRPRRALRLQCPGAAAVCIDLPARGSVTVQLPYLAGHRGLQRIDRLELSTRAPLGLFCAWAWLLPALSATIYPQPLRLRPVPPPDAAQRAAQRQHDATGTDEWAWLRSYRPGDLPQRVAWKAYARGGPLQVAHYTDADDGERWLDFEGLTGLNVEQRLSLLCAWILECDRRGEAWGLLLRGLRLPPRLGADHRHAGLAALAHFSS